MTVSFRILGVLLMLLDVGCAGKLTEDDQGTSVWSSESHPISIKFSEPWKLIYPQQDRSDRLLVALQTAPKGQGCSFSIRVGEDAPKAVMSDAQWYQTLQQSILEANDENELLDEYDVQWQDRTYHRIRFRMLDNAGKPLCQWIDTCRTGKYIVTTTNAFPFDQKMHDNRELPAALEDIRSQCSVFATTAENIES